MRKFASILFALGVTFMTSAKGFTAPNSDFQLIKGGSFTMGSPESEDWRSNDETQHNVTVSSFYMAKFEVTQKEWREITGKNPSSFSGDALPVESVTWLEAVEFCNALSKRDGRTPAYTFSDGGQTVSWNRGGRTATGFQPKRNGNTQHGQEAPLPFTRKKSPVRRT